MDHCHNRSEEPHSREGTRRTATFAMVIVSVPAKEPQVPLYIDTLQLLMLTVDPSTAVVWQLPLPKSTTLMRELAFPQTAPIAERVRI